MVILLALTRWRKTSQGNQHPRTKNSKHVHKSTLNPFTTVVLLPLVTHKPLFRGCISQADQAHWRRIIKNERVPVTYIINKLKTGKVICYPNNKYVCLGGSNQHSMTNIIQRLGTYARNIFVGIILNGGTLFFTRIYNQLIMLWSYKKPVNFVHKYIINQYSFEYIICK